MIKNKVSVLIPSRNERYLPQTVDDLFAKARGDIEVIVTLDGYWPDPLLTDRPNLVQIHKSQPEGMRAAINSSSELASGQFLMKCDAHCLFGEGWDEILKAGYEDGSIVIPRRYPLDAENWKIQDNGKVPVDYEYLSYPWQKPNELGMHGNRWDARTRERADILIDENMSFQGSCWFTKKSHFKRLGRMNEMGYGRFVQEAQELGLKTWLSGGRVLTNKKTYYAHLHKGKEMGRGYYISKGEMVRGTHWSADYWINNRWEGRTRDLEWLIDHFWPVPTWPEDWRKHVSDYQLGPDSLLQRREMAA